MRHIRNIFLAGAEASRTETALHHIYFSLLLTALGVGVGALTLFITAYAYASFDPQEMLSRYFGTPVLLALNVLPAVVLIWTGYFLFRRAWAAYLFSALPCIGMTLVNYYKIKLRGDPFLAADLRLIRTAGGIVGHYTPELTDTVIRALVAAGALLLLAILLLRNGVRSARIRFVGLTLIFALGWTLFVHCYTDQTLYQNTAEDSQINRWSDVEAFLTHGFCYPFLHSMPEMFPQPVSGYDARQAAELLDSFRDAKISQPKRVQVVGVMLEAFSDLTDFSAMDDQTDVQEIYAPLHELEARSISGNLLTNIFAGGTVDSEWGFLSGYSHHDEFRADVDSYVRYFKSQGYRTLYRHPGYGWFYNRSNVNRYLGFDQSAFNEDTFGALVEINEALYRSDGILFDYLLADLDTHNGKDAPLFLFSVTYQNHGPYYAAASWAEYIDREACDWSDETVNILNNYLVGIKETVTQLVRFTDELEQQDQPIVLVAFGDHKPWLGNDNSVYRELGVSFDFTTWEGFTNYYGTPYLIWANSTAKKTLGRDFVGEGGDMSPCLLMPALFDACGWKGPAFMQLARQMRAYTPLLHTQGIFWEDGVLTDTLTPDAQEAYRGFRSAEFYRENHALEMH